MKCHACGAHSFHSTGVASNEKLIFTVSSNTVILNMGQDCNARFVNIIMVVFDKIVFLQMQVKIAILCPLNEKPCS